MDWKSDQQRPQLEMATNLRISMRCSAGVDKYPAKAHARRVAQRVQQQDGLVVLSATRNTNWPNSDMPAPFRQDRYFYYLTGCNESDCCVTYNIKDDLLTLWLPPIDDDWRHRVFYGRGSTVDEALERYDIDEARYIKTKKPDCRDATPLESLMRSHWLYRSLSPSLSANVDGSLTRFMRRTGTQVLTLSVLQNAMDACRVIKDATEIMLVRKANEITAAAHISVMKGIHNFTNEAEIEAAYMQTCIARRAKEQAYDPIVGAGSNAAILHYSANVADFRNAQTVVIDAGCEVERYAADVTRTIPINNVEPGKWPSQEAENIYKLVESIQESCIKQVRPGNQFINIQFHAHCMLIEGLLKLGILKGDVKKILRAGTSMAFLPHGLGHHLGLDVHDASPDLHPPSRKSDSTNTIEQDTPVRKLLSAYIAWDPEALPYIESLTEPEYFGMSRTHDALLRPNAPTLEQGMIVTVEPGIYFSDFLLRQLLDDPKQSELIDAEMLQKYIKVGGVRIEDDILVTKHGYENLTIAPKGEEMLKIIREAAKSVSSV